MSYEEALNYLLSIPMFQQVGQEAFHPGLDKIQELDNLLGNPHKRYHTIHVGGTNGKGSCSHMIASVLMSAGYKVGLYTSPHLKDFRERIRVNGAMIDKAFITGFVERIGADIIRLTPSFFEATTALAFDYFAHEKVDVAVVEVGLGGRLDATNIITPLMSVITNIAFDHVALLGNSLKEIAGEKAGIIKPGVPAVIGETVPDTSVVFIQKAHETDSPLVFADQIYRCSESVIENGFQRFEMRGMLDGHTFILESDLLGIYQRKNIVTVLAALEVLKRQKILKFDKKEIEAGIKFCSENTGLSGRWQVLCNTPLIVCDTGHNEAGIKEVVEQIEHQKYNKLFIVLGVVSDKDLSRILPLLPKEAYYIFTRSSVPRALEAGRLKTEAEAYGLKGERVSGGVKEAVTRAKDLAGKDDMIFIGGSTFTVADI
ncbi:MAG TPA: bifunctional folylpolyglutamate synthase/dihydrofolate synthase [Candidatus Avirikenella pullistercoris]|nr:bifunctional folylpolyglutamate synthase/dihydrofolate synthase [Candidatus Avirikenella pullistercoris]